MNCMCVEVVYDVRSSRTYIHCKIESAGGARRSNGEIDIHTPPAVPFGCCVAFPTPFLKCPHGNNAKAKQLLGRALEITTAKLGDRHPTTISMKEGLDTLQDLVHSKEAMNGKEAAW